ncbi:MAG: hypothetical protein Ct9H300mP21_07010 [Pseudomonadota bacterium]|nr:MAG: hypothetical protein Ct9H300mP21_07010 [Pseudomonadota bacterium]
MNEGNIEQVGTSQEVFNAPVNQFVAQFVGGHNVIEGKIIEIMDKREVLLKEVWTTLPSSCKRVSHWRPTNFYLETR